MHTLGARLANTRRESTMDVNEAVVWPRSAREYTAQVIDAAVHAPNAVNQRPWAFRVVARTRF